MERRPKGEKPPAEANHARLAEVYAGQLSLPEAMVQGAQLKDLADRRSIALLCFERDPAGCHRSLLVDALMPDAERVDLFV